MKVVTLFVTFICLFLAHGVSSYGSTIMGDVVVETQPNGKLSCDSLICPEGTAQCHVTKRNDPNDFKIILRRRKCLGPNSNVLQEETVKEPNKYQRNVNVDVTSGVGTINGRPMTPEEQKEFDAFMKQTRERIQSQVRGAKNKAHKSLGPLMDGSFQAKLRKQINDQIRKSFNS